MVLYGLSAAFMIAGFVTGLCASLPLNEFENRPDGMGHSAFGGLALLLLVILSIVTIFVQFKHDALQINTPRRVTVLRSTISRSYFVN